MSLRGGRRSVAALVMLLSLVLLAYAAVQWQARRPAREALRSPSVVEGSSWEVAFNQPIASGARAPRGSALEERLVRLMDQATRTIDVAVYTFDLQTVAEAMASAAGRGVRVRMVTDTDTVQKTLDVRSQDALRTVRRAGIDIVTDFRQPIMHHKFTVIDGEWVQTGSWNYTGGDGSRQDNNMAVFRSPELAESYTAEFEKMFSMRRFGPTKPRTPAAPMVQIETLRVESYFAPRAGIAARLIRAVQAAQSRIHFLAFSFTHDELGEAIVARAHDGLEVQGVFELSGSETRASELWRMRHAGLEVYTDTNPAYMHHKVLLLDDRVTVFGSYNFSRSAERDNDENLLVVEDPSFTALFEQEFQRILAQARQPLAWPR